MKYKQSFGSSAFDVANVIAMLLLVFVMIYPFLYVFSVSVSDGAAVQAGRVKIVPVGFNLDGYKAVFRTNETVRAYLNTINYAVTGTVVILLVSCLAAYPLAQTRLLGRKSITFAMALTMIIPGGMIPNFLLVRDLHLLDTMWAIVLPPAFNVWYIVLIRTNMQQIPSSLTDSAYIDGAGHFLTLFRIVLPLSKPILATVALFAAVYHWNGFMHALLYLNDIRKWPLQMILRRVISSEIENLGVAEMILKSGNMPGFIEKVKMATVVVSIGPIVLAYPFLQKYFVRGTLVGSLKG